MKRPPAHISWDFPIAQYLIWNETTLVNDVTSPSTWRVSCQKDPRAIFAGYPPPVAILQKLSYMHIAQLILIRRSVVTEAGIEGRDK